jgi:hypothetical protein
MPVRRHSITSRRPNRVRIIGGLWRSRMITFPDLPGLRPTPDRVRETLFNWLGQDLTGRHCRTCTPVRARSATRRFRVERPR